MPKTILAFDLASKTGYAVGRKRTNPKPPRLIKHGAIDLNMLADETHGAQMRRFYDWLDETFSDYFTLNPRGHRLTAIYVEQAHLRGWSASIRAVGMYTVLALWADSLPNIVPINLVHTGTLKKHATGFGKATKLEMIEAAYNRWGVPIISDDHADALNLLHYGFDPDTS